MAVVYYRELMRQIRVELDKFEARVGIVAASLGKSIPEVLAEEFTEEQIDAYTELTRKYNKFKEWEAVHIEREADATGS